MTTATYSFYTPHPSITLDCGTEEITKQSHKAECDINTILSQFSRTGIIDHINNSPAEWLDLPDTMDFQQSLAVISEAQDAFASLPSQVRDYYQNSPAVFLGALTNPAEHDRLVEYGVLKPRVQSPPGGTPSPAPGGTPSPGAEN